MAKMFELRMASRSDSGLFVGKFPEPIIPAFLSSKESNETVHMYVREEDVQEDEELDEVGTNQLEVLEAKGQELKKKKRKKKYVKKSELILEQESESENSLGGVSKPINWVGNKVDTSVDSTSVTSDTPSVPKYAILQVVSGTGGSNDKHVNVLQVGDWFSFSRPSAARAFVTLDDVNSEFERQQRLQQLNNLRYNKRVSSYRSNLKKGGQSDETFSDDIVEVPAAFGKASTSSRGGFKGHLTESGLADVDSNEKYAFKDVDVDEHASDDEDDTGVVQAADNDREERIADVVEAYADHSGEDTDDEENEDEKAAEEKKQQLLISQANLDHLAGGAEQLESAIEFKQKVLSTMKDKDKKRKVDTMSDGSGNEETKASALKDSNSDERRKKARHVKIAPDVVSTTHQISSLENALTEENVRDFIMSQGGKVQTKVLMKEFKKAMKEIGSSAKDMFKEIVAKLTKKVEDPVLGTILVLK